MNSNYFCQNKDCETNIPPNSLKCSECNKKFCSSSCFKVHNQDVHQIINENYENVYNFTNKTKSKENVNASIYMKNGLFLSEYKENPYFNFDKFEIKRSQPLGTGALGEVFVAVHKDDKKKYAIKIVKKSNLIIKGEVNTDLIVSEINIHRRLIHNHIIKLYAHHENDHYFYLVNFQIIIMLIR